MAFPHLLRPSASPFHFKSDKPRRQYHIGERMAKFADTSSYSESIIQESSHLCPLILPQYEKEYAAQTCPPHVAPSTVPPLKAESFGRSRVEVVDQMLDHFNRYDLENLQRWRALARACGCGSVLECFEHYEYDLWNEADRVEFCTEINEDKEVIAGAKILMRMHEEDTTSVIMNGGKASITESDKYPSTRQAQVCTSSLALLPKR